MEDDKRVNYKLDAINKLINNLKLSISGNKEHDELGENNVIVNLDEISQKITELHEMVKAEFDEFENQHKGESDQTQTFLNNSFDKIDAKLDSMKTTIGNKLDTVNSTINKANTDIVAAINAMKASNDTKNDAIIAALQGLVTQVNRNTSNINSLNGRVDALEQA